MIGLGAGALTGTGRCELFTTVFLFGLSSTSAGSKISAPAPVAHIALQTLQRRYAGDTVGQITPQRTAATSSLAQRLFKALPPLGKNTFMLCLLGGGTLGSFVMSTTAGETSQISTFKPV